MKKVKKIALVGEAGKSAARYLWDGVIVGSSQGGKTGKDELRRQAALQRKLKAVTAEVPPGTEGRMLKSRDLVADCELLLDAAELELAEKLILDVPWGGHDKIAVADLLDLLSLAPEVEEGKAS